MNNSTFNLLGSYHSIWPIKHQSFYGLTPFERTTSDFFSAFGQNHKTFQIIPPRYVRMKFHILCLLSTIFGFPII
jgi:hypothetical protein